MQNLYKSIYPFMHLYILNHSEKNFRLNGKNAHKIGKV